MIEKAFIFTILICGLNLNFFGQSSELRELLNTGDCTTCSVGTNCQPNPLAGTEGFADLGYTIDQVWGTRQEVIINGRTFDFFNTSGAQRQMLVEAIEILPTEYIEMLPKNFRVGNPNMPYSMISAGKQIGGSKFCQPYRPENLQFESIVLHEAIFTISNKKHRTILHECGHFFCRKFNVIERMNPTQLESSREYLADDYGGTAAGWVLDDHHNETVAQCFMYFFHQMYFDRNIRLAVPVAFDLIVQQPARGFKRWMFDFIKPIIQETSSF